MGPLAAQRAPRGPETPELILQQAQLALGADTLAALAARWRTRASRDSGDQLARLGLAMTAVLTADSAEAERALDGLLDAGTSRAPVAAPIARYARYGQGLLYYAIGQWEAAVRALTEAADAMRAANDSAGEAQSLVNLVWLEARSHRPTASAHLARADSLIPPGAGQLRGAWHCADAALLSAHHAAGAVEAADSGAAIAHRVGDPRLAAQCEFAAAQDLAGRGRFDDALPRFGEVIALAARTRDHGVHAAALQWRGFGELNMGHYGPAENDLLAAVAEASAHGYQAGVGWGELNLAAIAEQLGDVVGARRHAARSLAALSIIGDSAGLGILRRSDARRALAVGDTATARASARIALQAAERHGRLEDVVGARLELAAVDVHENRWDSAAKELAVQRPLLAADRAQGWARILPWYEGRVSLGRGDPRTALQQFQRADLTLDSTQHLFRDQLHADIAVALLRTGDTAGALEALQQSERELETWRATLDDAGLRVLAFSATDILPGPPGGDAEVIAAAARSQRIAIGFALAERQRARELADQLVRAQALGTDGRAPVGVRPGSRPTGATPISLAQLQGALPDDSTALLEYVTGDGGAPTTLFAVTRRHVWTWIEPPVDSLVETIDRLDALVDHGANAAAPERTLGLALLGKIGALPHTIQRLVIVPDGPLHRVPFSALRLAGGDLVLEHYAVSLAPSATVVVAEWRRPAVVRTATVLAFGDPVLPPDRHEEEGDSIADRDAASALAAAGGLPRLPWTADEAALVGSFAPHSTVRLRTDASATFLEQTPLAAFSILHFATHAVVDEEVPARSALALAAGGGRSGYVGPADLAALHLTANLVVLSACRTARGAVVTGEGVRGLTSPLLAAGAHSVLATQWRLNDRDAVSLVYTLYLEMAAGLPIAEAVRRAELAARRAGRPEREWAAFILVGDPLVRIPLRAPAPAQVPSWVRHYDVAGS